MRCVARIPALAVLTGVLAWLQPTLSEDRSSTQQLLVLSALELLHARLGEHANATLESLVDEAAATVHLSKDEAGTALAALIGEALSATGEQGEGSGLRKKIEARAGRYSGVGPDTLTLFTTEVLKSVQASLAGGEDAFLDEVLGDAADAMDLDESRGRTLALRLAHAAAKELRPLPPDRIAATPDGVYVLAVHFQPSAQDRSFRGFKIPMWDERSIKIGLDYTMKRLNRSMSMKRKFRRLVPCYNIVESGTLLADYLLVLRIEKERWCLVADTRQKNPKNLDDLLAPGQNKTRQQRLLETEVYQVILELEETIETLPDGKRAWSEHATVKRYRDELEAWAAKNATFVTKDGQVIRSSSPLLGIVDLVTGQALRDFYKLK